MKLLHTSDWHLGRRLCGRERKREFELFLDWLTGVLCEERIDVLVVSGDVFDTFTPPQWAQTLYYRFLTGLAKTPCSCAVIVSGNHDSPALLDAPRELLSRLNVFVTGVPEESHEVFELKDKNGAALAVCCAVPYLRSRDLCGALEGVSLEQRRERELEAFAAHYSAAAARAEELRAGRNIPLIATGHCFVAGGKVSGDDGVRDLSVGSIDAVPDSAFSDAIDYLALGHLHAPQLCAKNERRRYSGSPLALGFGEAKTQKHVIVADFDGREANVRTISVPEWQKLARLHGTADEIAAQLDELRAAGESVWVEAVCDESGDGKLTERLLEHAPEDGCVSLLRVIAAAKSPAEALSGDGDLNEDWTPKEVFKTYLTEHEIDGEEAEQLMNAYLEALLTVREEDDETVQTSF